MYSNQMKTILLFGEGGYAQFPAETGSYASFAAPFPVPAGTGLEIAEADGGYTLNGALLENGKPVSVGAWSALLLCGTEDAYVLRKGQVLSAGGGQCTIAAPGGAEYRIFSGQILAVKGDVYRNGQKVEGGSAPALTGDCFYTENLLLRLTEDGFACFGTGYSVNAKRKPPLPNTMDADAFPAYRRPPRKIGNITAAKVNILPPQHVEKPKKGQLIKTLMPPIVMAALTVGSRFFMAGSGTSNILTLVMGAGMCITAVFSATSYFQDKKDREAEDRKRRETYDVYLLDKRKELYALKEKETELRRAGGLPPEEIYQLVKRLSSRLFERSIFDGDFLSVTLGIADQPPSYNIELKTDNFQTEKDPLLIEAETVRDNFTLLKDMPLACDLSKAHLGLVGEKSLVRTEILALLMDLCFYRSYHDLQTILITNEEGGQVFEAASYFPHMKLGAAGLSGLVVSENHRDMALASLTQILKDRKMKLDEGKKEQRFAPHYVLIVDEPKYIADHSIMEYLQDKEVKLGVSVVWQGLMRESLPENIGTTLMLYGEGRGRLTQSVFSETDIPVKTPAVDSEQFEWTARRLCGIRHNKGVTSSIPDAVTFFGLFGAKKPGNFDVLSLWRKGNSAKSLAVPLGLRAPGDIVYLNLHEKAHGPHGLVAGTTGSGKSEILQSYILSLALHFHPYEVGFLLIDYKGGGMANLFEKLPHLLGTITNLDGSESMRALASIKSENQRRQRIFTEAGVNNITNYTKAFRKGEATIPLPHLFIISDEFAELKKEQPDFMSELVSTARIGRSLGVHLILATQKPSGVVDDQIWSNSRFKLCLKVQESADSNEVLKTPDAAMITQPGRAYLQVGNNEIYELFQSAWSGAEYSEKEVEKGFDERVYEVNELGQKVLIGNDLSGGDVVVESRLTQLDTMVAYIAETAEKLSFAPVEKPWLPSLPEKLVSPHISVPEEAPSAMDLAVPVGLVDIPEEQKQIEYIHDFIEDGNFAVFGSSGFGKSTALMNTALTLATKNTPDGLHFYVMDLGNSALIQLKNLPHTADYMTYDQDEKIGKFVRILTEEMDQRKRLFAQESAINFKMYNQVATKKLPAIILFVDGFDVIKEIPIELNDFFLKLTRDGNGIGIYTVVSASQTNAIRYAILNNFKAKIALYMFEKSDQQGIVGRSKYSLPEMKGRAFVKLSDTCVMQCYLPVPFENDVEYIQRIGEVISGLKQRYPDTHLAGIPMLPEKVFMQNIAREADIPAWMIPIGLDAERVQTQYIDARESKHVILGKPQTGKSNILKVILSGISGKCYLVDSMGYELKGFEGAADTVYLAPNGNLEEFVAEMKADAEARQKEFDDNGQGLKPKDFYENMKPVSVFIDDVDGFLKRCAGKEAAAGEALSLLLGTGGAFFMTASMNGIRGFDAISVVLKDAMKGIVLGNPSEQTTFNLFPRAVKAEIDIGYLVGYGEVKKIKFPLAQGGK